MIIWKYCSSWINVSYAFHKVLSSTNVHISRVHFYYQFSSPAFVTLYIETVVMSHQRFASETWTSNMIYIKVTMCHLMNWRKQLMPSLLGPSLLTCAPCALCIEHWHFQARKIPHCMSLCLSMLCCYDTKICLSSMSSSALIPNTFVFYKNPVVIICITHLTHSYITTN